MKKLLLICCLFFASCVSVKVGLIDLGVFRFENIEIRPLKDQKNREIFTHLVNGKGSSLKEAVYNTYVNGLEEYGTRPDSLGQIYLTINKSILKTEYIIKANAYYLNK